MISVLHVQPILLATSTEKDIRSDFWNCILLLANMFATVTEVSLCLQTSLVYARLFSQEMGTRTNLSGNNLPLYSSCRCSRNILPLPIALYLHFFFFFLMIHEVILTETLCFLLVWSREFVLYFSCEQAGCFLKRREDYDMEKCCLTAYGMLCCRTMLFFLQKSLFQCHIMSFIFIFAGLFGALLNHNRNMQAVCSSTKATWHDYPKERIEQ